MPKIKLFPFKILIFPPTLSPTGATATLALPSSAIQSFTVDYYLPPITVEYKRIALFWAITQREVVIPYRRFGTTYWVPSSKFKNFFYLKIGPTGCTKT